jgi:radical SAM protein with 4Fe4S-binding SPASM domain
LTTSQTDSRPSALLPFETFKRFIDDVGDYLLVMVLWNWGEPFLNPDIFKIINYAASKGILVHTSTNGNVMFDDETADKIVDSGLNSLVFGVDGAAPETYQKYREGGDLEKVKENIRAVVRAKKRKASAKPILNLRFVAMQHNEHELPLVKEMAHELGVDFFSIKSVDMPAGLGENLDRLYRPENEKYRRYEYINGTYIHKKKPFVCMRPWKRIALDALGHVISCEYDYKNQHSFGIIGNGNANSTLEVWRSQTAQTFRRHFAKGHNDFYHCKACTYKDIRTEECNIAAFPIGSDQERC